MKLYCASDLHIGYEKTNYNKIIEFFSLVRRHATGLILCGDTFDLWRHPHSSMVCSTNPNIARTIDELQELNKSIPITIIQGNHDYNLRKLWPELASTYTIIADKGMIYDDIYFTHGWQFDVQQRKYSWAYGWLVSTFPYLYQRFMREDTQMGMPKSDGYSDQIAAVHREANTYAKKHGFEYIVMGHTHVPGIYGQDMRVVDCGDFVDSCSYAVIDEGIPMINYIK